MHNSTRNSTFEILRLIAMFMIVFEHGILSVSLKTSEPLSALDNAGWLCEAFTVCAVNLFFLLTGYFASSSGFGIRKVVRVWGKIIFYSLGIYVIAVLVGMTGFSIKTAVGYACPIFTKKYWFMQAYIVLIFLAPYIMTTVEQLSMKKHLELMGILLVFFCFHQTFMKVGSTLDSTQGYGIIWASVLLIVGSFLKKYGEALMKKIPAALFLAGYVLTALCIFASNWVIVRYGIAQGVTSRSNFYAYNSITVFAESVFLFCFFIKISRKGWCSQIVNRISASAVAVYLIGSHPLLLSAIWTNIFKTDRYLGNVAAYLGMTALFSVIVTFACIAVDMIVETILTKVKGLKK